MPSGPPLSLEASPLNSTAAGVSWQPPAPEDRNGITTGYLLHLRQQASNFRFNVTVNASTTQVRAEHRVAAHRSGRSTGRPHTGQGGAQVRVTGWDGKMVRRCWLLAEMSPLSVRAWPFRQNIILTFLTCNRSFHESKLELGPKVCL